MSDCRSIFKNKRRKILLIEDNKSDVEIVLKTFNKIGIQNEIVTCFDATSALDYIYQRNEYDSMKNSSVREPDLIILDLNLPDKSGLDILKELKTSKTYKHIPILIFTTSNSEKDITNCYSNGANGYIVKPSSVDEYIQIIDSICSYWLKTNCISNIY